MSTTMTTHAPSKPSTPTPSSTDPTHSYSSAGPSSSPAHPAPSSTPNLANSSSLTTVTTTPSIGPSSSTTTTTSTWTDPPWSGWIETTLDALIILEAARRGLIPRVTRRLVDAERRMIASGAVFVFDEDESGIKRWTDGFFWSPSRILGNFLLYRETERRGGGGRRGATGGGSGPAAKESKEREEAKDSDGCLLVNEADEKRAGSSGAQPGSSSSGGSQSLSRPKGDAGATGFDKQRERSLMGSLTNSYKFKPDGMMKKTFSLTLSGVTHHLISYYKIADVSAGRLRTPSSLPELAALDISPEYLEKTHFRCPPRVEVGRDGRLRYRGEGDEGGSSSGTSNAGGSHASVTQSSNSSAPSNSHNSTVTSTVSPTGAGASTSSLTGSGAGSRHAPPPMLNPEAGRDDSYSASAGSATTPSPTHTQTGSSVLHGSSVYGYPIHPFPHAHPASHPLSHSAHVSKRQRGDRRYDPYGTSYASTSLPDVGIGSSPLSLSLVTGAGSSLGAASHALTGMGDMSTSGKKVKRRGSNKTSDSSSSLSPVAVAVAGSSGPSSGSSLGSAHHFTQPHQPYPSSPSAGPVLTGDLTSYSYATSSPPTSDLHMSASASTDPGTTGYYTSIGHTTSHTQLSHPHPHPHAHPSAASHGHAQAYSHGHTSSPHVNASPALHSGGHSSTHAHQHAMHGHYSHLYDPLGPGGSRASPITPPPVMTGSPILGPGPSHVSALSAYGYPGTTAGAGTSSPALTAVDYTHSPSPVHMGYYTPTHSTLSGAGAGTTGTGGMWGSASLAQAAAASQGHSGPGATSSEPVMGSLPPMSSLESAHGMGDVGVRKMEDEEALAGSGHGHAQGFLYGRRAANVYDGMVGGHGSAASMGMGVGIRHADMGGVLGGG